MFAQLLMAVISVCPVSALVDESNYNSLTKVKVAIVFVGVPWSEVAIESRRVFLSAVFEHRRLAENRNVHFFIVEDEGSDAFRNWLTKQTYHLPWTFRSFPIGAGAVLVIKEGKIVHYVPRGDKMTESSYEQLIEDFAIQHEPDDGDDGNTFDSRDDIEKRKQKCH
jgi:hypothetical protein